MQAIYLFLFNYTHIREWVAQPLINIHGLLILNLCRSRRQNGEIYMNVRVINNYHTDENTYLIYNKRTGVVIDPGCRTDEILKIAAVAGVKIKFIFITHCHYDHIEYLDELRRETGAKLISSEKGAENVSNPSINMTLLGLGEQLRPKTPEIIMKDRQTITIDGMKIKCLYTPGHTSCGASYLTEIGVFTGDTLFLRSCGRWDLPTGDEETLKKSIRERLYTLNDDLTVYPGHGQKTSIGYEKKFNMFVK